MLLATEPSVLILKFAQILCWIVFPVLAGIIAVTVWMHYRRKKKGETPGEPGEEELLESSPEQMGFTNGDGEYVLFDYSNVIQQYKKRLSYNHARMTALQSDFSNLKNKYTALAAFTQSQFIISKNKPMRIENENLPKEVQEEVNKLLKVHTGEKEELLARIQQLGKSYEDLEQENRSIRGQLDMMTAGDEERATLTRRWAEENASLRDKIAEQEYLGDLLEEKNAEIGFLRSQAEQRIRQYHEAERQHQQTLLAMEGWKLENGRVVQEMEALKSDLLLKQEEIDRIQASLCGKEEQLQEKEQLIKDKTDQISYFENVLTETRSKNELFHAELADTKDQLAALQEQLEAERARTLYLEDKLHGKKQMIRRLHKELSAFVDDDAESPVIALKPEYGKGNEELVAH